MVNFILRRSERFAVSIVRCIPHISTEIMLAIKALETGIIHLNKYLVVHGAVAGSTIAVLRLTELLRYPGIIQSLHFIYLSVFEIKIKHRGLEWFLPTGSSRYVFRLVLCMRNWFNAIPIHWALSFYFKRITMNKDGLFQMSYKIFKPLSSGHTLQFLLSLGYLL